MAHERFTFLPYTLDWAHGTVTFPYAVDIGAGERLIFKDVVKYVGAIPEQWAQVPQPLLAALLQSVQLALGTQYWKLYPTSGLSIEGFGLSREQAAFWNELYTNGLAEFFYRSAIDFRGLVAFPFVGQASPSPTPFARAPRALLAHSGGKDSIVSAETLKEQEVPFDLVSIGDAPLQRSVAKLIGRPVRTILRRRDPLALRLAEARGVEPGAPLVSLYTFMLFVAAALFDYSTVLFSNEKSADEGNLVYRGLTVNHQWSKSTEAEALVQKYVERFITPSFKTASPLRQLSELEIVQRFAQYPQYARVFSSCNVVTMVPAAAGANAAQRRWCGTCPKCAFLFAALAAFLPKDEVVAIFGKNLFADEALVPTYRALLGLEGHKPFECVGTKEEAVVAMRRAGKHGAYQSDPAMKLFARHFSDAAALKALDDRVLEEKPLPASPLLELLK